MRVSEAYPSKYLGAEDLQGRPATVRIDNVYMEEMEDGKRKLALSFQGKRKSLICNKTNATKIAEFLGDETDHWLGQMIELYPAEVEYQGKSVEAIRVRAPRPVQGQQRTETTVPRQVTHNNGDFSNAGNGYAEASGGYAPQRQASPPPRQSAPPPRQAALADLNDDVPF